ncbi:MAG: hypothetical protein K0Q55_1676 [Verrucomicrobia bacterium]|jgi:hypothetical protein|nr:hypothetical protein [Verrucomicrobiota bacterium]
MGKQRTSNIELRTSRTGKELEDDDENEDDYEMVALMLFNSKIRILG